MARKTNQDSEPGKVWTEVSDGKSSDVALRTEDQTSLREYLLGSLPVERQEEIEARVLSEDLLFEELEIAEDELIDEFLADRLIASERAGFEKHFLSNPERQRNLRFAQAVQRHRTRHRLFSFNSQSFLLKAAAAVAAVTLLAGLLWFLRSRNTATPTFATATLSISHGDRATGAPLPELHLPVDELRLTLPLPEGANPAAEYRALLRTGAEATMPLKLSKQNDRSLMAVVPTAQLQPGTYAIKLSTIQTDGSVHPVSGSYSFALK
jgi:methionine-rich copper-binding protein CopC